jgi:predicted metal-dependent hydrolase
MLDHEVAIVYKKVKHANLKVKPNLEVVLTVPLNMTRREIDYILQKRAHWIHEKLALVRDRKPVVKELVSGEALAYLGKQYRLKVIEFASEGATLTADYLQLYVNDKHNYSRKQQLVTQWYRTQAEEQFALLIHKYQPCVNRPVNRVTIKSMTTRWGSCNPRKGTINLNLELIKYPKPAIEYVVLHELTHLIHRYHNRQFYNHISMYMPDWKERKAQLGK